MNKYGLILILTNVVLFSCSGERQLVIEEVHSGILTGQITRGELFEAKPDWMQEYISYVPAKDLIDSIRTISGGTGVEIFLGTWCSDSRREVSRFFKILDQCDEHAFSDLTMWALDRDKRLPHDNSIVESKDVWFVATIIFYRDGKELGRIVEFPAKSLEADMFKILKAKS